MANAVQNGAYLRFGGLPLWKFDQRYAPREVWIDAGRECFETAVRIREKYRHPVSVALTFTLLPGGVIRGADDLREQLDPDEHPALTLFPPRPDFLDSDALTPIDSAVVGVPWQQDLHCVIQEWSFDEESDETYRSLILVSLYQPAG